MCLLHRVVLCLAPFALLATTAAQDSSPKNPSPEDKARARQVLLQARDIIFPLRRTQNGRNLLRRIPPLLASSGDVASALDTLLMVPANERERIQKQIVLAQIQGNDISGALQTALSISSEENRTEAILSVVEAQAEARDFQGALRTAGTISPARPESAAALLTIAEKQSETGSVDDAKKNLVRARAAAMAATANDSSSSCALVVLIGVAKAQARLGESTESENTLQVVRGQTLPAFNSCHYQAYHALQEYSLPKQVSGPLRQQMVELGSRLLAFRGRVESPDEEEEVSESEDTGASESEAENAQAALRKLSTSRGEELTTADIESALEALRNTKPLHQRGECALSAAIDLAEAGKTAEAKEAVRIGLAAAAAIQDDEMRTQLVASLARILAMAGDFEAARASLDSLPECPWRTEALAQVARVAVEKGQAKAAVAWATAESSPLTEACALVSIAEGLLHAEHQHLIVVY